MFVLEKRVVVVGGGSFGSAIANRLALNVGPSGDSKDQYESEVLMWLYDEVVDGRKLSEIINESHENIKYLPGVKLPNNLHVTVDITKTVQDADVVFIVIPHQHIHQTLKSMVGRMKPDAVVVSMIKGLKLDKNGPELISSVIRKTLGTDNVAVVMGANIASDVRHSSVYSYNYSLRKCTKFRIMISLFFH